MPKISPLALPFAELQQRVQNAGVAGMGGGGFPAHLKLRPALDLIIINAAECEPLLHCDYFLLSRHTGEVLEGAAAVAATTGAKEIILAIKRKHRELIRTFEAFSLPCPFRITRLADEYPSGDEFFVIRQAAGQTLPAGTIPAGRGIFVSNPATFRAIRQSLDHIPSTRRYVSIAGAVARPVTTETPVGIPFYHLLALAGGLLDPRNRLLAGGVMMGTLVDEQDAVTKLTSAIIALPPGHPAIREKLQPPARQGLLASSACCQCQRCTDLCSRHQLGHSIEPHRIMRSLGGLPVPRSRLSTGCSGCGICSLYACPFDLFPRQIIRQIKSASRLPSSGGLPPATAGRRPGMAAGIPTRRLIQHLGLDAYDLPPLFRELPPFRGRLRISRRQHAGSPAEPVVQAGTTVQAGQLIGIPPAGATGAYLHSPAAGRLIATSPDFIIETVTE